MVPSLYNLKISQRIMSVSPSVAELWPLFCIILRFSAESFLCTQAFLYNLRISSRFLSCYQSCAELWLFFFSSSFIDCFLKFCRVMAPSFSWCNGNCSLGWHWHMRWYMVTRLVRWGFLWVIQVSPTVRQVGFLWAWGFFPE